MRVFRFARNDATVRTNPGLLDEILRVFATWREIVFI